LGKPVQGYTALAIGPEMFPEIILYTDTSGTDGLDSKLPTHL